MKYQPTKKSYLIAAATGLILAPLALADHHEKKADYEKHDKAMHQKEMTVSIGSTELTLNEIKDTNVINDEDERLGEVKDIVFDSESGKATHLIVSTDNWFDGKYAVVPLSAVSYQQDEEDGAIAELINTARVILPIDEDTFEQIATYERGTPLATYLETSYKTLANTLGLDAAKIYDDGAIYESAFVDRKGKISESVSSLFKKDGVEYRSAEDRERGDQKEISIGDQQLTAKDIVGVDVVNSGDDDLGKVVDIAVNPETEEAEYLVVRTDDWFDDKHAIIPISSVQYHADTDAPHPEDGAAWWDGEHLVLNMSEDEFDSIATYEFGEKLGDYFSRSGEGTSKWMHQPMTPSTNYIFLYTAPAEPVTSNGSYQTDHDKSMKADHMANDSMMSSDGSVDAMAPMEISLDGESIRTEDLKDMSVLSETGAELGNVANIVYDSKSGDAKFAVIQKNEWSLNNLVLIPIDSLSRSIEADTKQLETTIDESALSTMATFGSDEDVQEYIESNIDSIADTFDMDRDQILSEDVSYKLAIGDLDTQTAFND